MLILANLLNKFPEDVLLMVKKMLIFSASYNSLYIGFLLLIC